LTTFLPLGEIWDKLISVGAGIVIANPESGPGAAADENYTKYIQKTRDASIAVSYKKSQLST